MALTHLMVTVSSCSDRPVDLRYRFRVRVGSSRAGVGGHTSRISPEDFRISAEYLGYDDYLRDPEMGSENFQENQKKLSQSHVHIYNQILPIEPRRSSSTRIRLMSVQRFCSGSYEADCRRYRSASDIICRSERPDHGRVVPDALFTKHSQIAESRSLGVP